MFRLIHDHHKAVYTISVAAELLGCHPRTLRIYEEQGLVKPQRSQCRYRLYSQQDLTLIKLINELMDEMHLNLCGVKALFKASERFHIDVERMIEEMLR